MEGGGGKYVGFMMSDEKESQFRRTESSYNLMNDYKVKLFFSSECALTYGNLFPSQF